MDERPSWDEFWLGQLDPKTIRSDCPRRQVACILVDKRNREISTGYNGTPAGEPTCLECPCPGATSEKGKDLDACEAVHAEINALIFCEKPMEVHTVYVSCFPCLQCVKALMQTSAVRLVAQEDYHHAEAKNRWVRSGKRTYKIMNLGAK